MRKRNALTLVIAALVVGVAVGSIGLAVGSPTTGASSTASSTASARPPGGPGRGGPGGPGHDGGIGFGGGGELINVVSKLTGESTSTITSSLRSGSTLASIASTKSVTVDQIVALASNAPKAYLASEVSDGLVTQAQADSRLAALKTAITEQLKRKAGTGPGGFGFGGPGRGMGTSGRARPAPPSGVPSGTPPALGGAAAPTGPPQ